MTEPAFPFPGVHPEGLARVGGEWTRPFTIQQLVEIGLELMEQFLARVVNAVVGIFIPGLDAFGQLQQWATDLMNLVNGVVGGLANLINGLLTAPANFLGSIFDVLVDGVVTFGNMIGGLFGAFGGLPGTGSGGGGAALVADLLEKAGIVTDTAISASEDAEDALEAADESLANWSDWLGEGEWANVVDSVQDFLNTKQDASDAKEDASEAKGDASEALGNWADLINNLQSGGQPVNAANLFGPISVPVQSITNPDGPTEFAAGTFPDAESISGGGIWEFDPDVSRTEDGTGSVAVVADGTLKALRGAELVVPQGYEFQPRIYVKWDDYTGSGAALQLHVVKYTGDTETIEVLDSHTPAGSSGDWTELTGSYRVEAGVTKVRVRLVVTEDATGGVIHFDDGGYDIESNFVSNLVSWLDAAGIGDFFNPPEEFEPTDFVPIPLRDWISAFFNGLRDDDPPEVEYPTLMDAITDVLKTIPFGNVTGVGGPESIGASVQTTWDQLVSGWIGQLGSDASPSDVFNVGQEVSSRATRGSWAWDILGIRSNKSFDTGFLASSESPVALSSLAFGSQAPTFDISQSASTILFHRFSESGLFGAVAWQGEGNTSIDEFHVNIWKMDTETGDLELVHSSDDISGELSSTLGAHVYQFAEEEIMREPGDVFGVELTVEGAGVHKIVGQESWLPDQPVFPRRWAATRNSGTSAPPATISSGSVVYSSNVPFIEFAADISITEIPRSPERVSFTAVGNHQVEVRSWAKYVDLAALGGGRGGGGGGFGAPGAGGGAGSWDTITLEVGVDIKAGSTIDITVGGGGGGGAFAGSGFVGAPTVITYLDPDDNEQTLTGAAGTSVAGSHVGESPGNVTIAGHLYQGGGTATYSRGSAPGGGGGGGAAWGNGYRAADGIAWVAQRQN